MKHCVFSSRDAACISLFFFAKLVSIKISKRCTWTQRRVFKVFYHTLLKSCLIKKESHIFSLLFLSEFSITRSITRILLLFQLKLFWGARCRSRHFAKIGVRIGAFILSKFCKNVNINISSAFFPRYMYDHCDFFRVLKLFFILIEKLFFQSCFSKCEIKNIVHDF